MACAAVPSAAAAAAPAASDFAPALRCADTGGVFEQALRVGGEATQASVALPPRTPQAVIVHAHGYPGLLITGEPFADFDLELRARENDAIVIAPFYRGTRPGPLPQQRYGAPFRKGSQDLAAVARAWGAKCGIDTAVLISQSLGATYGGRAIAENPGTFDAWFVDGGDADLVETAIKYTPIAPLVPIVKHFMDDIAAELGGTVLQQPAAWQAASPVNFTEAIAGSGLRYAYVAHGIGEYVLVDVAPRLALGLRRAGLTTDLRIVTTERSQPCPEYVGGGPFVEGPYRGGTIVSELAGVDPTPVTLAGHGGDTTWCPLWDSVERFLRSGAPADCVTEVAEDYALQRPLALPLGCNGFTRARASVAGRSS